MQEKYKYQDHIKARIEDIEYEFHENETTCFIKFRWSYKHKNILDIKVAVDSSYCKKDNIYDESFGIRLAKAKAELMLYQRAKRLFQSKDFRNEIFSILNYSQKNILELALSNLNFYSRVIKEQYKYIDKLKKAQDEKF